MIRLVVLALALATAVAASAATPNTATIVFINSDGLQAVGADGTDLRQLRDAGCPTGNRLGCSDPKAMSWSPDGRRLAVVLGTQLYVFDTRDGSQRLLATGVDVSGASPPAWSPDGQKLAFLDLQIIDGFGSLSDVYVIDTQAGTVRKLTNGRQAADPAWAPGPQIVFSNTLNYRSEIFSVDPDGGSIRQLTQSEAGTVNRKPSWSPAGTEIAFVNFVIQGHGRLQAIRPDGTGLRTISELPLDVTVGRAPVWSPDGSRIALSTSMNGRRSPVSRLVIGRDLYVVRADGTAQRRLTESAERGFTDRDPTWSPDGTRLAFESYDRDARSKSTIYAVNADGTCERPLATASGWAPTWQPLAGSVSGRQECVDLSVVATSPPASGTEGLLLVTVINDGTKPLSDIRLVSGSTAATMLGNASRVEGCSVPRGSLVCSLGNLPPGESVHVDVQAESRVISQAGGLVLGGSTSFSVLAGEQEDVVSNNRVSLEVATTKCTTSTAGAGVITGTVWDDTICGRRGRDVIKGGDGRDVVRSGAGNDEIDARDGEPDDIRCGPGSDSVLADRADRVARDCERIRRGGTP